MYKKYDCAQHPVILWNVGLFCEMLGYSVKNWVILWNIGLFCGYSGILKVILWNFGLFCEILGYSVKFWVILWNLGLFCNYNPFITGHIVVVQGYFVTSLLNNWQKSGEITKFRHTGLDNCHIYDNFFIDVNRSTSFTKKDFLSCLKRTHRKHTPF